MRISFFFSLLVATFTVVQALPFWQTPAAVDSVSASNPERRLIADIITKIEAEVQAEIAKVKVAVGAIQKRDDSEGINKRSLADIIAKIEAEVQADIAKVKAALGAAHKRDASDNFEKRSLADIIAKIEAEVKAEIAKVKAAVAGAA
ncbi:UNVERIFIED_CONTAM: hypothetical protein HDU68_012491 [Siphonaria sp. JEL0065]|nr:hypothetical protein HDU68_012491 [Siphonaria sp. JEL0065]